VDCLARELGIDPAELRRRNYIRPEELPYDFGMPYRDGNPLVYDTGDFPLALEKALEAADYRQFRAEQPGLRARGVYRGIGISGYVEGTAIGPFEGVTVKLDLAGRVVVATGAISSGQGHETSFAQVAAAGLGGRPRAGRAGLDPDLREARRGLTRLRGERLPPRAHRDLRERRPRRPGRGRRGQRPGDSPPVYRRPRLRPRHQSHHRRGPGARRRGAGRGRRALRGDGLRRDGPAPDGLAHGLRGAQGGRSAADRDGAPGVSVAAQPPRR